MSFIQRTIEPLLRNALEEVPAVFLNGPRQAGKTTLVRQIAKELSADYVTLDDISTYSNAANDPNGFLRSFPGPVVIDEVQLVRPLFRCIKQLIDEDRTSGGPQRNGRFLLTGSASIDVLPELSDALVGRVRIINLYPFSVGEVVGKNEPVLPGLFDQVLFFQKGTPEGVQLETAIHHATFPEISQSSWEQKAQWFESYLTTAIHRDVRQLAEIEKISEIPNVLKVLARQPAGLLNDANCANAVGLNAMTYRRYRTLLEQLFLIRRVPAWHVNIAKQVVKAHKLLFTDTTLLCHLLGKNMATLHQQDPSLFGHVLENFVGSELQKQLAMRPLSGKLFHFRTHDGKEVDFIIERGDGTILGIEVKSKTSLTSKDFAHLFFLKEQIKERFVRGIVFYLGQEIVPFGNGMVGMPFASLWNLNMDIELKKEMAFPTVSGLARESGGEPLHGMIREGPGQRCIFKAKWGKNTHISCCVSSMVRDETVLYSENIEHSFKEKIRNGQFEPMKAGQFPATDNVKAVVLRPEDFGPRDFR